MWRMKDLCFASFRCHFDALLAGDSFLTRARKPHTTSNVLNMLVHCPKAPATA